MKTKIANIISDVFNAYLGLFISTFLVIFKERDLIPNWEFILFLTISLPLIQVFLFKYFKLIDNLEISDRKQRPMFHLFATIPNIIILFIALNGSSPLFVSILLVSLSINIVMGIVSIFWKMSGHLIYLSSSAYIILKLYFSWPLLIFFFLLLPLVAWARVHLQRHTIAQVIAGSIMGILIAFLIF